MPSFLNVKLSVISQYDAQDIPEYHLPPSDPNDPFTADSSVVSNSPPLISVYIPAYPCSTFWLKYSILPPHPPKIFYYFKLFINGVHVVSWGCGERDSFKGETMFGLYRTPHHGFERRVLSFAAQKKVCERIGDEPMEVKVYRSKGRRRIVPEGGEFEAGMNGVSKADQLKGARVSLIKGGLLSRLKEPKRFYKYALIDELSSPYAVFRYYGRTWDELERLGVESQPPSPYPSSDQSTVLNDLALARKVSSTSFSSTSSSPESIASNDNARAVTLSSESDTTAETHTTSVSLDSPLHIPITFALPPPPSPEVRALSPIKTSSSNTAFRSLPRTPTPTSTAPLRPSTSPPSPLPPSPAKPTSSNFFLRTLFRTPTPTTSLRPSISNRENSTPRSTPRSTPSENIRPSTDTSTDNGRRVNFGGLVAHLMRQSPSSKRISDGRDDFGGLAAHLMRRSPSPKRASDGVAAARVALEGRGREWTRAKRIASLGFLKGATRRRAGRLDEDE